MTRVLRVAAGVVLPLRHAVLRTGRSWADARYATDEDAESAHFAALALALAVTDADVPGAGGIVDELPQSATLLAVGSILPESPSWGERRDAVFRVRGMATRADSRSGGFGGRVLTSLMSHARDSDAGLVWLTARMNAVAFYARHGFDPHGDPGIVPGLGPHQTMTWEIDTSS